MKSPNKGGVGSFWHLNLSICALSDDKLVTLHYCPMTRHIGSQLFAIYCFPMPENTFDAAVLCPKAADAWQIDAGTQRQCR
jgi:hypothetical protein